MVKTVSALFSKSSLIAWLALLLLPVSASATPQFIDSANRPVTSLSQATFPYVVAGGPWSIPLRLRDRDACIAANPNASWVGARVELMLRGDDGQFLPWRSVLISEAMISNSCDSLGYLVVDPDLVFVAPSDSQEFKLRLIDSQAVAVISSDSARLYTSFWQKFRWSRRGKGQTASLIGDSRLAGMKATLLEQRAGSQIYRPVAQGLVKRRSSGAYLRLSQRRVRPGTQSYVCLDYYARYPKMWTGNPCPTTAVSAARLEELFPLSTASR